MRISRYLRRIVEALARFVQWFEHLGKECFLKQATIARRLECSLRTISRAVAVLKAEGRLKIKLQGPTSAISTSVEQPASEQAVSGVSGVAPGVAFAPGPYMNLGESVRKWRREVLTPWVVFLRSREAKRAEDDSLLRAIEAMQRGETIPHRITPEDEAFIAKIEAMQRGEI